MDVSRQKTAIIFSFRNSVNISETKNVSLNSIQSAQLDEFKYSRKKFINFPKTGKIAEVFFLRMRFHLMRQSELKMRANRQF